MYIPKLGEPATPLWFVTGVGFQTWSLYDCRCPSIGLAVARVDRVPPGPGRELPRSIALPGPARGVAYLN